MNQSMGTLALCLLFSISSGFSEVVIGGPVYNRQVFLKTAEGNVALSRFKNWELIDRLFLSPDETMLVVYHRPDKAAGFLLSLYSLTNRALMAEFEPGWACHDIRWTKDFIIWEWGTSGGGDISAYRYSDGTKLTTANFGRDAGIIYTCKSCEKTAPRTYRLTLENNQTEEKTMVLLEL